MEVLRADGRGGLVQRVSQFGLLKFLVDFRIQLLKLLHELPKLLSEPVLREGLVVMERLSHLSLCLEIQRVLFRADDLSWPHLSSLDLLSSLYSLRKKLPLVVIQQLSLYLRLVGHLVAIVFQPSDVQQMNQVLSGFDLLWTNRVLFNGAFAIRLSHLTLLHYAWLDGALVSCDTVSNALCYIRQGFLSLRGLLFCNTCVVGTLSPLLRLVLRLSTHDLVSFDLVEFGFGKRVVLSHIFDLLINRVQPRHSDSNLGSWTQTSLQVMLSKALLWHSGFLESSASSS